MINNYPFKGLVK